MKLIWANPGGGWWRQSRDKVSSKGTFEGGKDMMGTKAWYGAAK